MKILTRPLFGPPNDTYHELNDKWIEIQKQLYAKQQEQLIHIVGANLSKIELKLWLLMFQSKTIKPLKWILKQHFVRRVIFLPYETTFNLELNTPGYLIAQVDIGGRRFKPNLEFVGSITGNSDYFLTNKKYDSFADEVTVPIKITAYNKFFNFVFKKHK